MQTNELTGDNGDKRGKVGPCPKKFASMFRRTILFQKSSHLEGNGAAGFMASEFEVYCTSLKKSNPYVGQLNHISICIGSPPGVKFSRQAQ